MIDSATIRNVKETLHWRWNRAQSHRDRTRLVFVYDADQASLRMYWEWRTRAPNGPIEHSIRIENRGHAEAWIPLQDSLRLRLAASPQQRFQQLWIDKGASHAPPIGTHLVSVADGYAWTGTSSAYAHPRDDDPREIIPYTLVRDPQTGAGWYAGIEFSGRTRIALSRQGNAITAVLGLNPAPGPFRTRIVPGGSFTAPTVFLGARVGSVDDAGNELRRWVRAALNDPRTVRDPQYPLLTNNSWGSEMQINEAQARRMIEDARRLGFEMFHMDAGWFRGVGDWHPDAKKFPHGLAPVAAYAHARGMRFGLWADWAQAGVSKQPGALNAHDPATRDWLTTQPPPDWKPAEFKGITIDLGDPAAHRWAAAETARLVRDYRLDMLEHDGYVVAQGCDRNDHPHAPPDPNAILRYRDEDFLWVESANSTDVSYHSTEAYYDIQSRLKRAHPGLLLEICNDGGRMVDFGSAAHGDYFSIIDSYDPLSNRQAFYDASHLLPPAMLETYVKQWPAPATENFLYMLRSGMMGWFTLMLDTTSWTPEQHRIAKEELALYKSELRPLIRSADLYHVGPRPDGRGWDATEYFDRASGRGAVYAFHGTDTAQSEYRCALRGLEPSRRYRLRFHDHSRPDTTSTGAELMQRGILLRLPDANASEIILFNAESK